MLILALTAAFLLLSIWPTLSLEPASARKSR